jgi:hypothetical protein
MAETITVVLNEYRRGIKQLVEQLNAVQRQTIKADEVLIWHNGGQASSAPSPLISARCSVNLGVWARFAFALNATSEYVCVLDDDTIPGERWFENCLATIRQREALLGTVGILYIDPVPPGSPECSYYQGLTRVGWVNQNPFAAQVDFVGHAWFFRRAWLSTFWRELPQWKFPVCGEDMHFSAMLQKYLGVPTVVPPHPAEDKSLWGSIRGDELGKDVHSLWESNSVGSDGKPFRTAMDTFFVEQRRRGWRLINER